MSIAGKLDEDEVVSYFEKQFEKLDSVADEISFVESEYKPSIKVVQKDIEQCNLCMGLPTFGIDDSRYYPMQVLNNILGGTMSSRLFRNIREEQGLAYSIFSMYASYRGLGYFKVYAGLNRSKVADAINGIKKEISLLAKNGIEDDELEASREQLKAGFVFSQESTASRMLTNGRMAILLDRVVPIDEIINAYDSITKTEVEDLISTISDFTKYSAVAVTGKEQLDLRRMMV